MKKLFGSEALVQRLEYEKKPCSLLQDITIQEESREDFGVLEQFHYRGSLTPVTKRIYIARLGGSIVGGICYSPCQPSLRGRSIAVPEYASNTSRKEGMFLLNRDFLRIARVVVLPKFRGVGLGVKIVKETLPTTEYPFIETIAVMAKFNPFFEHAGMVRIPTPDPLESDPAYARALGRLNELGFDLDLLASANCNQSVLSTLPQEQLLLVRDIILKYFIAEKFAGMEFKKGVELLDIESMSNALTNVKVDMAYYIWKSSDPKFASLPDVRTPQD